MKRPDYFNAMINGPAPEKDEQRPRRGHGWINPHTTGFGNFIGRELSRASGPVEQFDFAGKPRTGRRDCQAWQGEIRADIDGSG